MLTDMRGDGKLVVPVDFAIWCAPSAFFAGKKSCRNNRQLHNGVEDIDVRSSPGSCQP